MRGGCWHTDSRISDNTFCKRCSLGCPGNRKFKTRGHSWEGDIRSLGLQRSCNWWAQTTGIGCFQTDFNSWRIFMIRRLKRTCRNTWSLLNYMLMAIIWICGKTMKHYNCPGIRTCRKCTGFFISCRACEGNSLTNLKCCGAWWRGHRNCWRSIASLYDKRLSWWGALRVSNSKCYCVVLTWPISKSRIDTSRVGKGTIPVKIPIVSNSVPCVRIRWWRSVKSDF